MQQHTTVEANGVNRSGTAKAADTEETQARQSENPYRDRGFAGKFGVLHRERGRRRNRHINLQNTKRS
jgi:hypothetical protein